MNILKSVASCVPLRVAAGPFIGTRCQVTSTGDGVVAKLAGTYEMEIYPAFSAAIRRQPDVFVDIGAAEGFYVSALARALPEARVVAYEAKPEWQHRIMQLAELNAVAGQCETRGFCDAGELRRLLEQEKQHSMFILMDIEGGEFSLLTPEVVPMLSRAELLVELHEPADRLSGDALVSMFKATHSVEVIWANEKRRAGDVPAPGWRLAARLLPPVRRRLYEGRVYRMRWMHAVPKEQDRGDTAVVGA
jgi:hypothetical protein